VVRVQASGGETSFPCQAQAPAYNGRKQPKELADTICTSIERPNALPQACEATCWDPVQSGTYSPSAGLATAIHEDISEHAAMLPSIPDDNTMPMATWPASQRIAGIAAHELISLAWWPNAHCV
jgi:hypothetical protein